jgi:hypothetical protein
MPTELVMFLSAHVRPSCNDCDNSHFRWAGEVQRRARGKEGEVSEDEGAVSGDEAQWKVTRGRAAVRTCKYM